MRLEAGPSFWANALIMVADSLPLPAEVIWWAFDTFLFTPLFFFEVVVVAVPPPMIAFLLSSEVRTQSALVTPDARALAEPAAPWLITDGLLSATIGPVAEACLRRPTTE